MHPAERRLLDAEPDLGAGDASECLPGWIESFCGWFEKGGPVTLSPAAVSALAHTLVAARVRAERLVRERDAARNP